MYNKINCFIANNSGTVFFQINQLIASGMVNKIFVLTPVKKNTLQKIVDKFYEEICAMVIGSNQMTNFDLEEIPPGIIDHKEWTSENGPNNA